MEHETNLVIEVIGEGIADIGSEQKSGLPDSGIVPILLHKLCGKPRRMRIKRKPIAFLSGKGLAKKAQFAKRQAFYNRSHAAVFVVDSEGGHKELDAKQGDLNEGRGRELPDFPMAIGVAHPSIESWLLAVPEAIRRGLQLAATPKVPAEPERLAAPCKNRRDNPKTVLITLTGHGGGELSAAEKDKIATAINDFEQLRARCPLGFAPFADEVDRHIRTLFPP
jgi:hypothetical protein